ncbi:DNA recombination and repair protein RecF [Enhygromyxa salina]|uniref:DNA replication and repair protein RecF n=1 Tax=Enhygromyxa salina TaxID=215803 RepID=A0A0C2CXS3_9BACT|nr:DNA replication/repair protein RecF [Enhygromyxa salina]KIG12622.1 DNA recombination and repair protein RecF [Enhygromyxa salina]
MQLGRLTLADFRNFRAGPAEGVGQVIEFGPRFTVLWGHNGAGKTNVLEGLYLISTLRSFRTADLKAMLRRGCDHARVEVEAFDDELGLTTRLEVRIDRTGRSTRRSARLDGKLMRSAVEFYGRVQAVLFTPEDLGILRGSPSARRQFLDRVVFARERAHIGDVQTYDKLLRSRNRVLKAEPADLRASERTRLLDTYDHGLSEVGARIWTRRVELVEQLRGPFAAAFAQIHDRDTLASGSFESGLRYMSRVAPDAAPAQDQQTALEARRETLAAALVEHRRRDEAARRTTVGPHLDDLEVTLDGTAAGDFASQGQARALVLAFKIAELRAARVRSGRAPLLLLDDVSSELDPVRSVKLFEALAAEVGQCVLTTTSAHHIELGAGLGAGVDRRDLELRDGMIVAAS